MDKEIKLNPIQRLTGQECTIQQLPSSQPIGVTVKRRVSRRSVSLSSPIHAGSYAEYAMSPAISFLSDLATKTNPDNHVPQAYETGDVIHHYTLGSCIGHGAFSSVHTATFCHPETNTSKNSTVAIKILKKPTTESLTEKSFKVLKQLYEETQLWGTLNHPNIIKMYQVMENKDAIFVVSEEAEVNLLQYFTANALICEQEAKRLFKQIAEAVLYMHEKKLVHRDIKCENILLVSKETPPIELPESLFQIDPFKAPTQKGLSDKSNSLSLSSAQSTILEIPLTPVNITKDLQSRQKPTVSGLAGIKSLKVNDISNHQITENESAISIEELLYSRTNSEATYLMERKQSMISNTPSSPEQVFSMSQLTIETSGDRLTQEPEQITEPKGKINDITKLDAKLGDFGLSKSFDSTIPTSVEADESGYCVGSLHYCSPEEVQGITKIQPSSDVWSLGCVLFAMLTGKLPFDDDFLPRLQYSIMNGKYDTELLENAVSKEGIDLVSQMLNVDEKARIKLSDIFNHPWLNLV